MAAFIALLSAVLFALAVALQQRGQFTLSRQGDAVHGPSSLARLIVVPVWLLGTLVLGLGYVTQGGALDRGKLVVVQPLLLTTIVWALPLGRWLTDQNVARRQVVGAGIVVIGLAMFVLVGDPNQGVDNAATKDLVLAVAGVSVVAAGLLIWLHTQTAPALRAAVYGVSAGLFFGLSASFAKPVIDDLHVSVGRAAGDCRTWALLGFGFIAFVIQQLSLATGQLAPAMAAVSVANPASASSWASCCSKSGSHAQAGMSSSALAALLAALGGAIMITLANRETEMPRRAGSVRAPP